MLPVRCLGQTQSNNFFEEESDSKNSKYESRIDI